MKSLLLLLLALPVAAAAQHPFATGRTYDPAVPRPAEVLGYEPGTRFTPHHVLMRYVERLAATSPRVRLDTIGHTFEGREVVLVTLTSEANLRRLDDVRRDAALLAGGGSAPDEVVRRMPTITWLGFTVHGNEASGTEASIALMYELAAGQDADTRMVLDSSVVLVDPVQNPDGHERHVQDVMRRRGALGVPVHPAATVHSGTWPGARTSHYHFDLNRDWFILSHPETRARVGTFTSWWPHTAADLHEMSPNSTYFFAPPMAPVNPNVDTSIVRWWDIYAESNARAFDRQGWSYFRREGYDEFYPGYGVSWPILNGAVGMTYEQASSAGGAIRRTDGTVLTLADAASHHYTAAFATVTTAAARRTARVRDYAAFRRGAAGDGSRNGLRSVVIARDGSGRADSLASILLANGIVVGRLRGETSIRATAYGARAAESVRLPAGSYVVDLGQPQGRLARALLEPDAVLDSAFIREELESRRAGQGDRFYDVTAWALPYLFRVSAWHSPAVVRDVAPVTALAPAGSELPAPGSYGYAFAADAEASLRLLAGLLADSVRVWYAPRAFRVGAERFARGAYVVRVNGNGASVHDVVRRQARDAGARVVALGGALVDEGTDLGSNSVVPVRPPRVAMLAGPPVNGNSFGFAWYALDQRLRYPFTPIEVSAASGAALADFDVLVVPSSGNLGSELGKAGEERLARWVRDGGVLVTLGEATAWLASEGPGLARLRTRRDSARADSAAGAPLPASVPGAVVRVTADTLSPLLAGIRDTAFTVLVSGSTIYRAPRDLRPGEAVVRYAPEPRLRVAGYLWPEVPSRLAGTPWLWTERVGRGRVIGFAGDPNFRDLWRGLYPIFANAVLLGGAF